MADYVPQDWTDDDGSGTTGTPVTKARMDYIEGGIRDASIRAPWEPVVGTVSTNVNVLAPGALILDGEFAPGATQGRILLLGQTDPSQNGIWDYFYNSFFGTSSLDRVADASLPEHFWRGRQVFVIGGNHAEQWFTYVGFDSAYPDSDPITFHASGGAVGKAFAFLMGA